MDRKRVIVCWLIFSFIIAWLSVSLIYSKCSTDIVKGKVIIAAIIWIVTTVALFKKKDKTEQPKEIEYLEPNLRRAGPPVLKESPRERSTTPVLKPEPKPEENKEFPEGV